MSGLRPDIGRHQHTVGSVRPLNQLLKEHVTQLVMFLACLRDSVCLAVDYGLLPETRGV